MNSEAEPDRVGHQLDTSALSAREREILDVALEGYSAREIAQRLCLSEATIRSHLSAIYSKLGVRGRVELLARSHESSFSRRSRGTTAMPRRTPRSKVAMAGGLSVLLLALLIGFVALPTNPTPESNFASVRRLISSDGTARVEIREGTLMVTDRAGTQHRLEGLLPSQVDTLRRLAVSRSVPLAIMAENDPMHHTLLLSISYVVPMVLLAFLAAPFVWMFKNRHTRAAGS